MTRVTSVGPFGLPRKKAPLSPDAFTPNPKGRGKVTFRWSGDVDGDVTDGDNWDSSAGTIPVNGDCVIFNQGSVDVDENLSQTTVPLIFMGFHPAYTGNVGTSSTSLAYPCKRVSIHKRTGSVYLDTGDATDCNVYVWDTAAGNPAVTLGTISNLHITNLYVFATRGTLVVDSKAKVDNIFVLPRPGRSCDVSIDTSVTADDASATNLRVNPRGKVVTQSSLGTVDIHGGIVETTGTAGIDDLYIDSDGVCLHRSSGTIDTRVTLYAGGLTLKDNENDAITIDDATIYPRGVLNIETDQNTAVITNNITFYGGRIIAGQGRTVTPA